jgi:crossover junction endodeoxyribonuclease RuvC
VKILGLDPGLGTTGWGLIEADGNRLKHVANGQLKTDSGEALPKRLSHLATQLEALIADHSPALAAVEEVFVNKNPQSTLKLGQARGVVIMTAARAGIDVGEYAARLVKKAVVGNGNAEKAQVHAMVARLLPGASIAGPDAADALAVAIAHAHHLASARAFKSSPERGGGPCGAWWRGSTPRAGARPWAPSDSSSCCHLPVPGSI